jgi:hypothetical protein
MFKLCFCIKVLSVVAYLLSHCCWYFILFDTFKFEFCRFYLTKCKRFSFECHDYLYFFIHHKNLVFCLQRKWGLDINWNCESVYGSIKLWNFFCAIILSCINKQHQKLNISLQGNVTKSMNFLRRTRARRKVKTDLGWGYSLSKRIFISLYILLL